MCLYFWQAKTQQMIICFVGCKKPNHRESSGWRELFGICNSPHDFWGKIQREWWFHKLGLCIWYQRKLAWKTYISISFLHAGCLKTAPLLAAEANLAWAAWTCCKHSMTDSCVKELIWDGPNILKQFERLWVGFFIDYSSDELPELIGIVCRVVCKTMKGINSQPGIWCNHKNDWSTFAGWIRIDVLDRDIDGGWLRDVDLKSMFWVTMENSGKKTVAPGANRYQKELHLLKNRWWTVVIRGAGGRDLADQRMLHPRGFGVANVFTNCAARCDWDIQSNYLPKKQFPGRGVAMVVGKCSAKKLTAGERKRYSRDFQWRNKSTPKKHPPS